MRAGTSDRQARSVWVAAFVAVAIGAGIGSLETSSAEPSPRLFSPADETGGTPLPVGAGPPGTPAPDPSLRLLVERLRIARREPAPPANPAPQPGGQRSAPTAAEARPPVPPAAVTPAAVTPAAVTEPVLTPSDPTPPAPLPGDEWIEHGASLGPDAPVGASDDAAAGEPRRRGRLLDLLDDARQPANRPTAGSGRLPLGGRLLDRLRPDRRQQPPLDAAESVAASPDAWPRPAALLVQLDALRAASPGHGDAAVTAGAWSERAIDAVHAVLATRGPRDPGADREILACSEHLPVAMTVADTIGDSALATQTRRTGFALARRTAVWRAAATCLKSSAEAASAAGDGPRVAAASRGSSEPPAGLAADVAALLWAVEGFESAPSVPAAAAVRKSLADATARDETRARYLVRAVSEHYRAPNVRLAVHRRLVERLLPAATVTSAPLEDFILGRRVHGTRTVEQSLGVRFLPDSDEIRLELLVTGEVKSRTVTDAGPVSLHSRGAAAFTVRKPVVVSANGLSFGPALGAASNQSQLANVQTSFDAVPIMGSLARTIARREHDESMPEATREVNAHIISRACREVDGKSEAEFTGLAERVRQRIWRPLTGLGLAPQSVALESTADVATARLRLAAEPQLAAHTPRPRAPADAVLSVQVHESMVNNAADRLELAGRTLGLEPLLLQVCGKLGVEPRLPEDLPEGVEVTFADAQPLRVECQDGLVHVQVSLATLQSGRRSWSDVVARVDYRPLISGRQVHLEREGPVQIGGPGHQGRMELALRTIFGKIFPRERRLPLLPATFVADSRLAEVVALQAVCADGWFAMALGDRPVASAGAAPPARR